MLHLDIRPVDDRNVHILKALHQRNLGHLHQDSRYTSICHGLTMSGFLAFSGCQPVGEITVQWQLVSDRLVLYISSIGVVPAFRRRGVATRLMDFVRENSWDARYIHLHTHEDNYGAQNLYKKLGFVQVGRVPKYYRQRNCDALVFKWANPVECEPIAHRHVHELLSELSAVRSEATN
jgi:ribosomal protein S18 acetylase RimI-like enzyme